MKAIFVGSIGSGFALSSVVDDAAAKEIVTAHLSAGDYAEALDVRAPATLAKAVRVLASGAFFVAYGTGLGSGFSVYGPFAEYDIAERFAEANRSDNEWELFETASNLCTEVPLLMAGV